jgi:hypothetical protein
VTPTATLPAGTDLYIVGANAANTRITQDAYGSGNYSAYTGRHARGTAASPTASQSGDFLTQLTGRGYGATGFAAASTGYFSIAAAENFTDTAQGTYASVYTTAIGANSPTEVFRFGTAGQFGIGAGTYGTSGYVLTSGGASAAPTWSQVSATGLTGILPVANGGTGLASWTTGSLVYASASTTLAGLADVATGNVLLSGGVGVAPAWGQVSLTTAVTGTLPIANGGTGLATTPANGALDIGNGTGFTRTTLTAGTNIAITNGAGSISIATVANPTFSTSVTSPLHIGGTAASSSLTLQSTSGVGTTDSILFKVGNNGATTAMTISTLGSLGIGVTPAAWANALQVGTGSSMWSNNVEYSYFGTNNYFGGANWNFIGTGRAAQYSQAIGQHLWYTSSASGTAGGTITWNESMRIDSGGNVGIGTSSPSSKLEVVGASSLVKSTASSGYGAFYANAATGNGAFYFFAINNTETARIYSDSANYLGFATGSSGIEKMRIDSSGNVGIGTSSPGNQLVVSKSQNAATVIQLLNNNAGASAQSIIQLQVGASAYVNYAASSTYNQLIGVGGVVTQYFDFDTQLWRSNAGTEYMRINSSGNVGIGTTSPSTRLSVVSATNGGISVNDGTVNTIIYNSSGGVSSIGTTTNHSLQLYTNNVARVTIDTSGNVTTTAAISDSIGNVRTVPENTKTAAYVLVASDSGKYINITTGGITVNASIFTTGQSVTVYNNSASAQTITQGTSVTMYLVGTATTGNRTLAQRGLCTIFCVASNTFVITGGGLT